MFSLLRPWSKPLKVLSFRWGGGILHTALLRSYARVVKFKPFRMLLNPPGFRTAWHDKTRQFRTLRSWWQIIALTRLICFPCRLHPGNLTWIQTSDGLQKATPFNYCYFGQSSIYVKFQGCMIFTIHLHGGIFVLTRFRHKKMCLSKCRKGSHPVI